jgi:hypothetical protein
MAKACRAEFRDDVDSSRKELSLEMMTALGTAPQ